MKTDRRVKSMADLQIKGMDDELYANLKDLAASENRSISQQVLFLLKLYLGRNISFRRLKRRPRFC